MFDGQQIRTLMKDKSFVLSMNDTEKNACNAFVKVTKEFLGNKKSENYIEIVNNLMDKLQRLKINMSIKVHLLFNHLEDFPENLGAVSDEQGERFHQDIRVMEVRYQGRWDTHMIADYCWTLMRDCANKKYSRKSKKQRFVPNDT